MQWILILAMLFSPAATASNGYPVAETPLAILGIVVLLLLIKANAR